jgi:hypothetical protein
VQPMKPPATSVAVSWEAFISFTSSTILFFSFFSAFPLSAVVLSLSFRHSFIGLFEEDRRQDDWLKESYGYLGKRCLHDPLAGQGQLIDLYKSALGIAFVNAHLERPIIVHYIFLAWIYCTHSNLTITKSYRYVLQHA